MMPQWKYWTVLLLLSPLVVTYAALPDHWGLIPCFIYGIVFAALVQPHVRGFGKEES